MTDKTLKYKVAVLQVLQVESVIINVRATIRIKSPIAIMASVVCVLVCIVTIIYAVHNLRKR